MLVRIQSGVQKLRNVPDFSRHVGLSREVILA